MKWKAIRAWGIPIGVALLSLVIIPYFQNTLSNINELKKNYAVLVERVDRQTLELDRQRDDYEERDKNTRKKLNEYEKDSRAMREDLYKLRIHLSRLYSHEQLIFDTNVRTKRKEPRKASNR